MSHRARPLLQALATLVAVAVFGSALWWATRTPTTASADATRAAPAEESAEDAADRAADLVPLEPVEDDATAVPAPTSGPPTPAPSPTPLPEPAPLAELIGRPDLADELASPMPECSLIPGSGYDQTSAIEALTGTVTIRCLEGLDVTAVVASAPGRIVHIVNEPAELALLGEFGGAVRAAEALGRWDWAAQGALGPHVVIDHGTRGGARSVQTVYAGLSDIDPDLAIGQQVDTGAVLGTIAGPRLDLRFSLWVDNVRQDGAVVVGAGPDETTQRVAAGALGPIVASPTDPACPLSLGSTQLPGASREYRNGTHQGIDFGCGTSGRFGHAIADGTVVYLVDDYRDPTVPEREALLQNAAIAGLTPHWTLVMLYGNVVVIDHGEIAGAGRVYTITAHLETVDPAIRLGATVERGQTLGELGNRGTNASAEGRRGAEDPSLHLHWELFIDDWYLGAGQPPAIVEALVRTALCGAAETPGCPA